MTAFDNPLVTNPVESPVGNQGIDGARGSIYGPQSGVTRFVGPLESTSLTPGAQPVPFRLDAAVVPTALTSEVAPGVPAAIPPSSFEMAAASNAAPPRINVAMEATNPTAQAARPTATVERDGSILDGSGNVVVDKTGNILKPDFITSPPIGDALLIQVQKPSDGAFAPTDAQKHALDQLTQAWASRIQASFGDKLQTVQTTDGTVAQVPIDDPSKLVSAPVEQLFGNNIPPEKLVTNAPPPPEAPEIPQVPDAAGFAPQAAQAAQRVNHDFPQGGSGTISSGDANRYYPARTPEQNEGASGDYLNMLSGVSQQPVDSIRRTHDNGYSFGMFGVGSHTFADWFVGILPKDILEKLGHPPDFSKLAEILKDPKLLKEFEASLKKHHVPGDLAKELSDPAKAKEFADFTQKLATGKGDISRAEMKKFMPEALQNRIATDTINDYKHSGATPSDIALAMQLDKKPSELTAAERQTTEGKSIVNASNRLYHLSHARQGSTSSDDEIRWTGDNSDPSSVHYRLVHAAKQHQDGTGDGCVRTFSAAFKDVFGIDVHGNGFDCFKDAAHKLLATGKYEMYKVTKASDLNGALFIGQTWSAEARAEYAASHNGRYADFGHVAIMAGGTQEVSSRNYVWNSSNGHFAETYAVRAKTDA
jgi:hypothetical protein